MHGFLRLTVDKDLILCESLGVDETTNKTTGLVTKNVVATKGATQASRTWTGDVISPNLRRLRRLPKPRKRNRDTTEVGRED
jgi:hypothetical protein